MIQVTDFRKTRVYREAHAEGREEGIEKGIEKGREEGREEGIERVARRLIKMELPVSDIVKATGLTAAQIRRLGKKATKSS